MIEYLRAQREHMHTQIAHLQDACQTLDAIINDILNNKEHLYSPEILRHFAQLAQNHTNREIADAKKSWEMLTVEIQSCLDQKPESPLGRRLARRWKSLLKEIDSSDPLFLGAIQVNSKEQDQKFPSVDQEVLSWIEKALAYEKKRGNKIEIEL